MTDYVNVLKSEHRHILNELDKFQAGIDAIQNETALLKVIREFIRDNSGYIKKHLVKEETFYEYLDQQLGNLADLKELTKRKEMLMEELSRLHQIKNLGLVGIKIFVNAFIQGIKVRIYFEEETVFKIAEQIPEKNLFE
jgi:hemerythrin-like domain-containing protein